MAIQYDYFKNPPQEGDEGKRLLHPRPVVISTLKTDDLAQMISSRSSFSPPDLVGILRNLAEELYQGLSNSHNVYLEGIGTFSVSLESRYVENRDEIRSPSIRVKDIHFRPDKKLKDRFKGERVVRVKKPAKRVSYAEEERFARIGWYIDRNDSINVSTVMKLNNCMHKTALDDLERMIDRQLIKRVRFGRRLAYTR